MSYVEKHLLTAETVVFRTQLHWKIYAGPVLLSIAIFLPLALLALASEIKVLASAPILVAVIIVGARFLQRRSSEFAVTNRRVVFKIGFFTTRSLELLLSKIEGIAVNQSFMGKMLNYGDITVTGSGGTKEAFSGIQAPLDFRHAVQEVTEARG